MSHLEKIFGKSTEVNLERRNHTEQSRLSSSTFNEYTQHMEKPQLDANGQQTPQNTNSFLSASSPFAKVLVTLLNFPHPHCKTTLYLAYLINETLEAR